MGNFYTNITLKGPSQEEIAHKVNELERWAVVSNTFLDSTVIYDRESEAQDGTVYELAKNLSTELNCFTLAVTNHDDSVFYYDLYKTGKLIDTYNSSPNYFGNGESEEPSGGKPDVLAKVFDKKEKVEQLTNVLTYNKYLDEDDGRYTWETNRHQELFKLLELPLISVGFGYSYLCDDELPDGLDISDCYVLQGKEDA